MEHEMIDLLDESGKYIGVVDKAIAHKEGLWHKSVHVWLVNNKDEILLAHRCKEKTFFPNCWDCAFAGHIGAGETSLDSAIREGEEEIGLNFVEKDFEYLFTFKDKLIWQDKCSNEFVDVYLIRKNIQLSNVKLQKEEVDNIKWMKIDEFFSEILSGKGEYLFHGKEEYLHLKEHLLKITVEV